MAIKCVNKSNPEIKQLIVDTNLPQLLAISLIGKYMEVNGDEVTPTVDQLLEFRDGYAKYNAQQLKTIDIKNVLSKLPTGLITDSQIDEVIKYAEKFENPILIFKGLDGKKNIDGTQLSIHEIPNTTWGSFNYNDALSYAKETGRVAIFIEEGKNLENLSDLPGDTPLSQVKDIETRMIQDSNADIVTIPRKLDNTKTPQVIMKGNRDSIGILNPNQSIELTIPKIELNNKQEVIEQPIDNKEGIKGIEINSYQTGLGNSLTNVHYAKNGKSTFDIVPSDKSLKLTQAAKAKWGESVEAWYKSNNAQTKGIVEGVEGDKYDFNLMVGLITDKLTQYPNLVEQINQNGGLGFLQKSTHNMGNGRWSSKNTKNMFMNSLMQAYKNVSINQTVNNQEGIDFIFEQSPELAKIGSKEQYAQYISTIFPESKVKDIVYHGSKNNITKFNSNEEGIFFTKDKEYAKEYGIVKGNYYDINDSSTYTHNLISVILDIKNPQYSNISLSTRKGHNAFFNPKNKNNNVDGVIGKDAYSENRKESIVVFEPSQIHILGNKQDQEGFKKYINDSKRNNKITTAEISNLIKQGEIVYLDENKKPCKNWTK